MYSSTESTQQGLPKLTSMSLFLTLSHSTAAQMLSVQLTAEEGVLITVVSTVVVAVTQVFRVDADVVVVTLDLALRTRPVSWNGER